MVEFEQQFPNYVVTKDGVVYKNGSVLKPFKSNKYLQVVLYDVEHKRHIFGVHTLVAMLYLDDFYKGCVVHHKDKNTHNNCLENLEVQSRAFHSRNHAKENDNFKFSMRGKPSWNKGMKMSEEFCAKCSASAKRRGFNGNQYIKCK